MMSGQLGIINVLSTCSILKMSLWGHNPILSQRRSVDFLFNTMQPLKLTSRKCV